jgi:Skp family chaperone for outer membrane proteins
MKNIFFFLLLSFIWSANAQTRGIKIGYIDMEYILQNVPDYTEANNQLEQKAQKWKQEIEAKKTAVNKLKDALKTEKVLLTKELIEEREEEIRFQETELSDFQQKKFGPNGEFVVQKAVLVKPIQDQVFNAVQDIAEARKYDFILDKSSDLTLLFAAKRHDVSSQVLRAITRASSREQKKGKELKEQEKQEALEDMAEENPELAERQKKIEERKAAREKMIADKKAAAEEKRRLFEEKRKQEREAKEAKRKGTSTQIKDQAPADDQTPAATSGVESQKETQKPSAEQASEEKPKSEAEMRREQAKALRDAKIKEQQEKRAQIQAQREAAKKAKEEQTNKKED